MTFKNWYLKNNLWSSPMFWLLTLDYAFAMGAIARVSNWNGGHYLHPATILALLAACWVFILRQHREVETRAALSRPLFVLSATIPALAALSIRLVLR